MSIYENIINGSKKKEEKKQNSIYENIIENKTYTLPSIIKTKEQQKEEMKKIATSSNATIEDKYNYQKSKLDEIQKKYSKTIGEEYQKQGVFKNLKQRREEMLPKSTVSMDNLKLENNRNKLSLINEKAYNKAHANTSDLQEELNKEVSKTKKLEKQIKNKQFKNWTNHLVKDANGNIIENTLGTVTDLGLNVIEGVANIGDQAGRLVLHGVADLSETMGNKKLANKIKTSLKGENKNPLLKAINSGEKSVDKYSYIGDSGDQVANAIGYTAGMWAGGEVLGGLTGTGTVGKVGIDTAGNITKGTGLAINGGNIGIAVGGHALNIPTLAVITGMSGGLDEAYSKDGVTKGQAWFKALGSGTIEGITEGLFGVFGVGGSSLDDALTNYATKNLKNGVAKALTNIGISATGETIEEFLSYAGNQGLNYLIDKASKDGAKFYEKWNWEEVGQEMAIAFLSTAISQGGSTIINLKSQNVKDSVIKNVEEQLGRNLTKNEKTNILNQLDEKEEALESISNKNITLPTINDENTNPLENLGQLKARQQEIINHQETKKNQLLQQQMNDRIAEIQQQVENIRQEQQNQNIPNASTQNMNLQQSAYVYKIDPTAKSIELAQRLFNERGIEARFDENMPTFKDSNIAGVWLKDDNGNRQVILNPNASEKTIIENLAMHELTHDLMSSENSRNALKANKIIDYVKTLEGYAEARRNLEETYASQYNPNNENFQSLIDEEVVADILGKKLGSQEFINRLVNQKPNIAQRIYDWVKDKIVNRGGKIRDEDLFWKNVANRFEKAYKMEYNNSTNEASTRLSKYGTNLDLSNVKEGELVNEFHDSLTPRQWKKYHDKMNKVMDSTYGDLNRTDFIDGKIVCTEIKNHKEQVVNVMKVSNEYKEKVKYFIEEANKYGYDGQELQSVIEEVFGKENVSRYDTSNNKFIRVSKLEQNINGTNENDRYSNRKTTTRENINTNKELNSSFSYDSNGRKLTKQQQEFFKDSKARDRQGRLITLYHGTGENFTIFDRDLAGRNGSWYGSGFYFTTSKENARSYAGDKGKVIESYLNIKNPYIPAQDVIKSDGTVEFAPSFYEDFANKYKDSLPTDWNTITSRQKGNAVRNILEDNGYDGIIYGDDYIVFNSNQIKNVDNTNPTSNEDIRYSKEAKKWDEFVDKNVKPTGATGTLMAIHNLSEDKLMGVLDLGGFPVPSIAITDPNKVNHSQFGNISVLFNKDTIDPSNYKNEVYDRDVWSPTFPQVEYELNEDGIEKVANDLGIEEWRLRDAAEDNSKPEYLIERLLREEKLIDKYINDNNIKYETAYKDAETRVDFHQRGEKIRKFIINNDFDFRKLYKDKKLQQEYFDLIKDYYDNSTLPEAVKENIYNEKITQLKDYVDFQEGAGDLEPVRQLKRYQDDFDLIKSGENKVVDEWQTNKNKKDAAINNGIEDYLREEIKDVYGDKGIRNDREIFTPSGNRRSFWQLHDEYNLENIVDALTKGDTTGTQNWFAGFGQIQANMANRFNSISDIKANENRLTSLVENNTILEEARNNIENDIDEIVARNDTDMGIVSELLADFARRDLTVNNFKQLTRDYYQTTRNVPDSLINKIIDDMNALKNLPTDYFEAKPQRAVGLDEVEALVIPNNTTEEFRKALKDAGIDFVEYDPNVEGDRNRVINKFDNLKFSKNPNGKWQDFVNKHFEPKGTTTKLGNIKLPTKKQVNVPTKQDILPINKELANKKIEETVEKKSYEAIRKASNVGKSYLQLKQNEVKTLKNDLKEYLGLSKENLTNSKTYNGIKNKVEQFVNRQVEYLDEDLKLVKKEIRNTKIKVDSNLKDQITDYNDFKKQYFGKLRLTSDGQSIDSIYQELSDMYPYYFNPNATTEADMLYEIADFMDKPNTIVEEYKISDNDIKKATDKVFNALIDNSLSNEDINAIQEEIMKKYSKRTRRIIQEELLKDMGITVEDISKGKDINALDFQRTDPIRLHEKVFGAEVGQKINDATVNRTKHNEAERTRFLNKQRDEIRKLEIKPRSKESAAVQKYAEREYLNDNGELVEYGDKELARDFPNVDTQNKIKHAAEVMRNKYDSLIDDLNSKLTEMGYDPIPKRENYMPHFQTFTDALSKIGFPISGETLANDALPTDINGLTDQFKPGKNWFANAMKRKGVKTDYDAITGIDKYLESASNILYHTEDIQRYRTLSRFVRETFGQEHGLDNVANMSDEELKSRIKDIYGNKLSKYAAWLDEQANALAGKKGGIDRAAERLLGRKIYSVLDGAKKQVGSNMTGFNVRSALTNFASAVQGASKTKKMAFLKGTISTLQNIAHKDNLINKSDFLTSRFGSDQLSKKFWQKASNAGQIFMTGSDYFTANQIWRSKYYENLSKGMSEKQAIKNADDFASRIMGDRSKGATAEIFNSKTLGLLTQFQLEVNNQWSSIIHDNKMDIKTGNKSGATVVFQLGQLAAMSYFFNNLMKSLTGSDVMIDPIDMLKKILGGDDDDKSLEDKTKEAIGDLINDIPFASFMTGGRIPMSEAFKGTESLFNYATGQKDKYGNNIKASDVKKDLIESGFYWLLPTGYGQAKKTYKGASMYDSKLPIAGSYTDSGNLRFNADTSIGGKTKAILFGQYASEEAQKYIDRGYETIRKERLDEMKELNMSASEYAKYRKELNASGTTNEDKIEYIANSNYTDKEKNIMASNVLNKNFDIKEYNKYDSYDEYQYATKYPEKYAVIKYIAPYSKYNSYKEKIKDIRDNTTNDKDETIKYINSLNMNIPQKAMFIKQYYKSFKSYDDQIIEYIDKQKITKKEKEQILTQLGFIVKDGRVYK